jgi:transketolase
MVGVATGLACRHKIAFCSSLAACLIRAVDQIRLAGISGSNIKLVGSHAGVNIG